MKKFLWFDLQDGVYAYTTFIFLTSWYAPFFHFCAYFGTRSPLAAPDSVWHMVTLIIGDFLMIGSHGAGIFAFQRKLRNYLIPMMVVYLLATIGVVGIIISDFITHPFIIIWVVFLVHDAYVFAATTAVFFEMKEGKHTEAASFPKV